MVIRTFMCNFGGTCTGTCTYDSDTRKSVLVVMGGQLSVVSSAVADGLIDESASGEIATQSETAAEAETRKRGQSVTLPSGTSYDGLIAMLEEPWNMTDKDRSRIQEVTTQLAARGDGVYVTCSCEHIWVLPITAEPVH
jgi:hypothetical protein